MSLKKGTTLRSPPILLPYPKQVLDYLKQGVDFYCVRSFSVFPSFFLKQVWIYPTQGVVFIIARAFVCVRSSRPTFRNTNRIAQGNLRIEWESVVRISERTR